MTYTHVKDQGQRSFGSSVIEWKYTDKRTDTQTEAIALPPVLTRSIKISLYRVAEKLAQF